MDKTESKVFAEDIYQEMRPGIIALLIEIMRASDINCALENPLIKPKDFKEYFLRARSLLENAEKYMKG